MLCYDKFNTIASFKIAKNDERQLVINLQRQTYLNRDEKLSNYLNYSILFYWIWNCFIEILYFF